MRQKVKATSAKSFASIKLKGAFPSGESLKTLFFFHHTQKGARKILHKPVCSKAYKRN